MKQQILKRQSVATTVNDKFDQVVRQAASNTGLPRHLREQQTIEPRSAASVRIDTLGSDLPKSGYELRSYASQNYSASKFVSR